jgi:hypothetical protein
LSAPVAAGAACALREVPAGLTPALTAIIADIDDPDRLPEIEAAAAR